MYGYIYKTTNLLNGKIYIGQHRANKFDTNYYGSGVLILKAIKKYGINNFNCEIIEECDTIDSLNEQEKYWIDYYNSRDLNIGYNISEGGGIVSMIGDKNPMWGKPHPHKEETKQKISNTLKELYKTRDGYWLHKHHSEETKQKMSRQRLGKKLKRRKENYIPWNLGTHLSEEHKKKVSQANSGRHLSVEAKAKISKANKGRKLSSEYIEILKQRVGKNNPFYGKHHSKETKDRVSNKLKGKIFITDGTVNKRIDIDSFNYYEQQGFYRGVTRKNSNKNCNINVT